MLVIAAPVSLKAAPALEAAQHEVVDLAAENQLVLFTGETSPGEPEAVMQLDKSLLTPILQVLLQRLYPLASNTVPAPHSYPASKGDSGLHTILTKGP
ncbi:hypothetical protein [Pontibacter litorisediminis]|uniref:hypothetical protein n=1 Tax=Pontibacter litorisediminis TaxID=1846260 RepID=UPI0023EBF06C|nr:hypothetical protein [Pontibacter litorisediminis]